MKKAKSDIVYIKSRPKNSNITQKINSKPAFSILVMR